MKSTLSTSAAPPTPVHKPLADIIEENLHKCFDLMSMHPSKQLEFEFRLGKRDSASGKFNPDVSPVEFDRVLRAAHDVAGVGLKPDCANSIEDFFYLDPSNNRQVRQRNVFYSTKRGPTSEAVYKKRLWDDTMQWGRVSVCEEEPVSTSSLPILVSTTRVCFQQRCTVLVPLKDAPHLVIRAEFSNVWAGTTDTEAAIRQQTDVPIKTVEFELEGFTIDSGWLKPGMIRERAVQITETIRQTLTGTAGNLSNNNVATNVSTNAVNNTTASVTTNTAPPKASNHQI